MCRYKKNPASLVKVPSTGLYKHHATSSVPRFQGTLGEFGISYRCVTYENEFYQLLEYKDDVDLEEKLLEWENFYNLHRPHGAFNGMTPFEVLRKKLL